MKRRNVRTLSLVVLTFTYLLIGAAVFDALEGEHNEYAFEALTNVKDDFMTKYNMTEEDYKMVELLIIERKPHKNGPQWKFEGKKIAGRKRPALVYPSHKVRQGGKGKYGYPTC